MTRIENSNDPWLETAAKRVKVQTSNSIMWTADVFFMTRPVTIALFIFIEK